VRPSFSVYKSKGVIKGIKSACLEEDGRFFHFVSMNFMQVQMNFAKNPETFIWQ